MQKKLIVFGAIAFLLLSAFVAVGIFQQKAKTETAQRPYRYGRPVVRQYYRGPAYYAPPRVYRGPSYYGNYYRRPYYNRGIYVRPGHVSVGPIHVDY